MAVTLDFETFYNKDYSLSKMTTEQYIRDARFQIIGVGIKVNNEPTYWVSSDDIDVYREALAFTAYETVISHNAIFDMSILTWILGIKPKLIVDTLSMARPLHGSNVGGSLKALAQHYELGVKGTEVVDALGKRLSDFTEEQLEAYSGYCKNDVDLTYKLFCKLYKVTTKQEMLLIDQTIRLHTEPVLELDTHVLGKHLETVQEKRKEALRIVLREYPDLVRDALINNTSLYESARAMLASNSKLASVLEELGVPPPMKMSAATGKMTYAFGKTDKEFTALLEHEDPRVQAVVEARIDTKSSIEESRTKSFMEMAKRGAMPIPLGYCGATTTWRWSGMDKINVQNLPRGGALRHAMKAPEGYVIVACDSSNIELRINHTLAGQESSVNALRNGDDLYCEFASMIFGRQITKADKMERMLGKISSLGLGYAMGATKFQETVRIQSKGEIMLDDSESKRIVSLWRNTYPAIPRLWKQGEAALSAIANFEEMTVGGYDLVTTTTSGLKTKPDNYILYPNLTRNIEGWTYDAKFGKTIVPNKIYGGKVIENICQHLARNIIAEQWLTIAKRYKVVLQVHDEIVIVVPEDQREEAEAYMLEVMSKSPDWWPELPLAAEASSGESYGDAK